MNETDALRARLVFGPMGSATTGGQRGRGVVAAKGKLAAPPGLCTANESQPPEDATAALTDAIRGLTSFVRGQRTQRWRSSWALLAAYQQG